MHFPKSALLLSLLTLVAAKSVHADPDGSDGSEGGATTAAAAATADAADATATTLSKASSTGTSSSARSVQTVHVGGRGQAKGALVFEPDNITAEVGSQIEFRFDDATHSVMQGAFDKPCQPIGTHAFYSGSITAGADKTTTFTITVNNTNTLWLYCADSLHCKSGMAAVVNAPKGGQTLNEYKDGAAKLEAKKLPGPTVAQGGVLASDAKKDDKKEEASTTGAAPAATSSSAAVGGRGALLGGVAGLAGVVGGLLL